MELDIILALQVRKLFCILRWPSEWSSSGHFEIEQSRPFWRCILTVLFDQTFIWLSLITDYAPFTSLSMKQECLEGKQICLRTLTPYARKASLFLDGLVLSTELIMDGGLTLETSALETPYGGQFTKSTQLIK